MKNDHIINSNRVHTAGEFDIEIAMLDVKGNLQLMIQQIVFNLSKIYFDISTSFIGSRKKNVNAQKLDFHLSLSSAILVDCDVIRHYCKK